MKNPQRQLGFLAMTLLTICGCGCDSQESTVSVSAQSTSAELVDAATDADPLAVRELAAVELARRGDQAIEEQRTMFVATTEPVVRGRMADALGDQRDWQSVPALLDAMETDDSPLVRRRASIAMMKIIRIDYGYDAAAPPARRTAAVAKYRAYWNDAEASPWAPLHRDKQLMRAYRDHNARKYRELRSDPQRWQAYVKERKQYEHLRKTDPDQWAAQESEAIDAFINSQTSSSRTN
jgi:hypothetical protein